MLKALELQKMSKTLSLKGTWDLLALTKFSLWEEEWALVYNSMNFRGFPDIS